MGCPFAQLSPLLLLSCLVLFFQFGASFLSPKPLLASLQRGRSLAASSRGRTASPPPHHRDSSSRGGSGGGKNGGGSSSSSGAGPRMLGVSGVLEPAELQVQSDDDVNVEDLGGEPLDWTESLGTGGPLFYADLLRSQVSALQLGLGLDRSAVPRRMDTVCNVDKKSRVRNLIYTGDRVRKVRMSYLDSPGMQVFSSVAYSAPEHDFPLLSISAMAMGQNVRVLALDLQPLFPDADYAAKYASAVAKLKAIREKYPEMQQELRGDYYKGSPFFSNNMMYARWGPEQEASGFMENVVKPAFEECIEAYVEVVTKPPPRTPGSRTEKEVVERHVEFDRFHSEREQVRPIMSSNFGMPFADKYISEFLFAYGGSQR